MSVIESAAAARRLGHWNYGRVVAVGTECFGCGGHLGGDNNGSYPVIHWLGHGHDINLHPECAKELVVAIAADASRAKAAVKQRRRSA